MLMRFSISTFKNKKIVLHLSFRALSSEVSLFNKLTAGKVLLITSTDDYSQQIYQKLWVKIQKNGGQCFQFKTISHFPNNKEILEGLALARRTGVTSIVAVGSDAVADIGKAVRHAVITGSAFTSLKNYHQISSDQSTMPLVIVPFTLSPSSFLPLFVSMHEKDDVLIRWPCSPPTEVYMDPDIVRGTSSYSGFASTVAALSALYDILFSIALSVIDPSTTSSPLSKLDADARSGHRSVLVEDVLIKFISSHAGISLPLLCKQAMDEGVQERERIRNIWALSSAVAALRTSLHIPGQTMSSRDSDSLFTVPGFPVPPATWTGPLELATCMLAVQSVLQLKPRGGPMPGRGRAASGVGLDCSSWLSTLVMKRFLDAVNMNGTQATDSTGDEAIVSAAVKISLQALYTVTQLSDDMVSDIIKRAEEDIASARKGRHLRDVAHVCKSSLRNTLEEQIFSFETDMEPKTQQLVTGSTVSGLASPMEYHIQQKLKLLRSDLYIDFVESLEK